MKKLSGLLHKALKNDPHGDTVALQMNPQEAKIVTGLLTQMGGANVRGKKLGLLQFYHGGIGGNNNGGGTDGGNNAGGDANNPGGGNGADNGPGGGGLPSGSGGGPHSPFGSGGGITGSGDHMHDNKDGALGDSDVSGFGGISSTPAEDPRSIMSLFGQLLHPTPTPTTPIGVFMHGISLPAPGMGIAMKIGQAMGIQNAKVMAGIESGNIPGKIGTDINGTKVGISDGSQYGGTQIGSNHIGTASNNGPQGLLTSPFKTQQDAQNAINASTGMTGSLPTNLPGLLSQYQAPTQQYTIPGYGFQTPGYGYLQWGRP